MDNDKELADVITNNDAEQLDQGTDYLEHSLTGEGKNLDELIDSTTKEYVATTDANLALIRLNKPKHN